jgi:hypothetical protein
MVILGSPGPSGQIEQVETALTLLWRATSQGERPPRGTLRRVPNAGKVTGLNRPDLH